ncbi:MAG: lactate racemase domain-containing protein [Candidatus Neomarinimicrobiota bacterium]
MDYLVASGTHQPMTPGRILEHVGITPAEHQGKYRKVRFFIHVHDRPEELRVAGTISAAEIKEISEGLFGEDLPVTVNKRLFEYDLILILGPVAPHEAAGFSGGNKYFFPGVAGDEIINHFHWISAVITNPVINGVRDNPSRVLLNKGASLLGIESLCFSFVVTEAGGLACLFIGSPEESWEKAVDYSTRLHIVYKDRAYPRILGLAHVIYDDLWIGGKVMYKLEPIIADGGELVIYAPQINELSYTHGKLIREVGYHVRDYFLKQWDRFAHYPKLILAHSTNVRGVGTFENGVERPRVKVTLATGIPDELCRQVNLGYMDPSSIDISEWQGREAEGLLVVENAGQVLYRLKAA